MEFFKEFYVSFFGDMSLRIAPLYLATTVLIAVVIYRFRYGSISVSGFVSWLLPSKVYLHTSHLNDIKIFVLSRLLFMVGAFNLFVVSPATIIAVVDGLTALTESQNSVPQSGLATTLAVTLVIVIVSDFCVYWVHRIHHEWPVFWPFHAVHHSAEVLTPITVYRKHPVYDVVNSFVKNLAIGIVVGGFVYVLLGSVSYMAVGQANILYVIFNLAGSNFRHSHIWISYGPWLERVLISPAQHQIHHSSALEHHNKNYGEVFALWDWMFGTLYVPQSREDLTFGLADADGNQIEQPHPNLKTLLIGPVL